MEPGKFIMEVYEKTPAYRKFLDGRSAAPGGPWESIPLIDKKNYLLSYQLEELCWGGSLAGCHLIGASSGFSRSGTVFWPKRPADEKNALEATENMLVRYHGIDKKSTLILVCLAFGTWIGGMQIAALVRALASTGKYAMTAATPSLNLAESVEIYRRFGGNYDQTVWITNPSNVNLITALIRRGKIETKPGAIFFGVVGEYFTESFREKVAADYCHPKDEPFCIWTGYGSADTGDIAAETAATIKLRKHLHRDPALCEKITGQKSAPMILARMPGAFIEIIDGNIVVTKDQLIPLVRYDTRDAGGLLSKSALAADGVPKDILEGLPEDMLFVYGRAGDAVIFYGTNLLVSNVNDFLLGLPPEYQYGGFFEVRSRRRDEITVFNFTLFVGVDPPEGLAARYEAALIGFLKSQSLEFNAKYDALCRSVGEPLIRVGLKKIDFADARLKHRYVIEEDANV